MYRIVLPALVFLSATVAHADLYSVDLHVVEESNPFNPPTVEFSFTFDTDHLVNNSFEPASGFSCGPGGQDCFATSDGVLVYRAGLIQFFDPPVPDTNENPDAYFFASSDMTSPLQLFIGPDDNPQVVTGTFAAGYYYNYATYEGTGTITDLSAAPEPSSLVLLGSGIAGGLAALKRRVQMTK